MARVEAVVFDIGNVLIAWNPERFFDSVMPDRAARKKMFNTIDLHGMNEVVDRGGPWRETIYETAAQFPEYARYVRMWYDRWIEMASPEIAGSVKLIRALRVKGVPVFAFSNFGIESFAYAQSKYPFLNEFDRRFISGHMGVIKPEPLAYRIVEDRCGISPAGLLFTDDRPANIDAATKRGWQGHLFNGPEGLARRLVDEGMLTKQEAKLEA